jgi:hypothetical protein
MTIEINKSLIQFLLWEAQEINCEGSCAFRKTEIWIQTAHYALESLPHLQGDFNLYCINTYEFPLERIRHGVFILNKALRECHCESE